MSDVLEKGIKSVQATSNITKGLGLFAGLTLLISFIFGGEDRLDPTHTGYFLAFGFLTVFTGWNSCRELRLILAGRAPRVFFYLSHLLCIIVSLGFLVSALTTYSRLGVMTSDTAVGSLLFVLIFWPSVHGLRVAALAREITAIEAGRGRQQFGPSNG